MHRLSPVATRLRNPEIIKSTRAKTKRILKKKKTRNRFFFCPLVGWDTTAVVAFWYVPNVKVCARKPSQSACDWCRSSAGSHGSCRCIVFMCSQHRVTSRLINAYPKPHHTRSNRQRCAVCRERHRSRRHIAPHERHILGACSTMGRRCVRSCRWTRRARVCVLVLALRSMFMVCNIMRGKIADTLQFWLIFRNQEITNNSREKHFIFFRSSFAQFAIVKILLLTLEKG